MFTSSATVYMNEVCSDGIKPKLWSNWSFSQIKRDISIQVSLRGTLVSEPNVTEYWIWYQMTRIKWSLSYCELQMFIYSLKHSLMSLSNTTNHFSLTIFRSVESVNQTALVPLGILICLRSVFLLDTSKKTKCYVSHLRLCFLSSLCLISFSLHMHSLSVSNSSLCLGNIHNSIWIIPIEIIDFPFFSFLFFCLLDCSVNNGWLHHQGLPDPRGWVTAVTYKHTHTHTHTVLCISVGCRLQWGKSKWE